MEEKEPRGEEMRLEDFEDWQEPDVQLAFLEVWDEKWAYGSLRIKQRGCTLMQPRCLTIIRHT